MDAISFLTKEHDKVRKTLRDISDESHRYETKKELFDSLCHDLIRHENMEHKIWYPHFKNSEKLEHTVKHLLKEEKSAEKAIKTFDNIATEKEWENKFAKFKKDVENHASEEEEKLFPNVAKILDKAELEEIGKKMLEFKREY